MFRFRPSCPNWNETAPYADVQPNHVGRTVWLKQATDPRRVKPILRAMKKMEYVATYFSPRRLSIWRAVLILRGGQDIYDSFARRLCPIYMPQSGTRLIVMRLQDHEQTK